MPSIHFESEAEWLALREQNVGGSEVASLFYLWALPSGEERVFHLYETPPDGAVILECLSSFKSGYRLWLEKSGMVKPESLDGVERVDAGKFIEPALAAWASSKWDGWKLRKVRRYLTHATVNGWGCSLDYEVHQPGMPPVEFKNIDFSIFRRDWVADGEEILVPPIKYMLQLQAQIGVSDADHGWVVACVGGNELKRGRIERHGPTQDKIQDAIEAFWKGVQAGEPPALVADYDAIAEQYRFGQKIGAKDPGLDLRGDNTLPMLCRQYLRRKRHLARVEAFTDNTKARIAALMGDSPRARASGFKISWPVIERPAKQIPARWQDASTYRAALTVTPLED